MGLKVKAQRGRSWRSGSREPWVRLTTPPKPGSKGTAAQIAHDGMKSTPPLLPLPREACLTRKVRSDTTQTRKGAGWRARVSSQPQSRPTSESWGGWSGAQLTVLSEAGPQPGHRAHELRVGGKDHTSQETPLHLSSKPSERSHRQGHSPWHLSSISVVKGCVYITMRVNIRTVVLLKIMEIIGATPLY